MMKYYGLDVFDNYVITNRGIIPEDSIRVGDKVYNYDTGELETVMDYLKEVKNIREVTFSDKRILYVPEFEGLHQSPKIAPLEYLCISKPPVFSPYLAGALMIYGDQDNKYINVPIDKIGKFSEISLAPYILRHSNTVDGLAYLYHPDDNETPLLWIEIIPYRFYATSNHFSDDLIPVEYIYSSLEDRIKFLQGVFDVGYDRDRFGRRVGISHNDRDMLNIIQRMLWSVGIPSILEYRSQYNDEIYNMHIYKYTRYYELLITDIDAYPRLFNKIENIQHILSSNLYKNNLFRRHRLHIISNKMVHRQKIVKLKFNKDIYYYTGNFLPRQGSKFI